MYNHYPEELIEEVRINNDIVDVVSEYVKLEKKGKDFFGLCPFHKEKTPSFSVAAPKQIFYCFGCGKGGNVVQFIMNVENLDYIESVKLLADRAHIQLPEGSSSEEVEKTRLKQEIIKINTEAARFFFGSLELNQNENARQYLKNRSISPGTIRKFGLGFSSEEWDLLYNHLLNKGFKEGTILKSGLILPNKKGGYYDRFRGRIMFPIFDVRGNVIGFGGRVMDSSLPKYMNSPETLVYSKGKNLYALNLAKSSGEKRIIIVEGYMDVISLHQSGIINTVASLGTALTESQGRILKKYAEEIIISYDSDTAGQAATMRGLDILNDIGCSVKVLIVPQGKDPDEFIRKNGSDEYRKLIDNSLPLVEYKVKVLKEQIDFNTTDGEIKFKNKIIDILLKIDNHVEREMYVRKFSREYKISEESLLAEIDRRLKPRTNFKEAVINPNMYDKRLDSKSKKDDDGKLVYYERILLSLLCLDNGSYKAVKGKIAVESFSNDENKQAASIIFDRLESKKGIVSGELLSMFDGSVAGDFARIIQEKCNCEDNTKAILDIIKGIELYKLSLRKQEIHEILNDKRKQIEVEILNDKRKQLEGDVEKLNQELMSIIIKQSSIKN